MLDPYCYPGTNVLRNKFGIRSQEQLNKIERELVVQRSIEIIPTGKYDLDHLRSIHRHLFQDIYDWAGEIRTVDITKGETQFHSHRFIDRGFSDINKRLVKDRYLKGLATKNFAEKAGEIIADVNFVHPFREGNGRTQLQFLKQLATTAGHTLRLEAIEPSEWIQGSKDAILGPNDLLGDIIRRASSPTPVVKIRGRGGIAD